MRRSLERGQTFTLFAIVLAFLIIPFAALAIDLPSLWMSRRERQKLTDEACLAGAIAAQNGQDTYNGIIQSFNDNGVEASLYTPGEGSGVTLGKGIEIGSTIRVGLWGPTLSWWSQLIPGATGWEIGARAHCQEGLGGFLPLSLKEWEGPGSRILETDDPNDEWSGPCPDQTIDPESDVTTRSPAYCWVWGDWQVLAGDGHRVNEGDTSMNGLIAPDIRCQGPPGPENKCIDKIFIPPVPEGAAANSVKAYTRGYIAAGGYNGPLPVVGEYYGVHSALIGQQEGVSNNFLAQEIANRFNVGDYIIVFVYDEGTLYDGNKNYDYVEVIGYAVVQIVYIDANTVAVAPIFPATDIESDGIANDLPRSPQEIGEAGFIIHPILLPWE